MSHPEITGKSIFSSAYPVLPANSRLVLKGLSEAWRTGRMSVFMLLQQ
jgi:hypothetical protein